MRIHIVSDLHNEAQFWVPPKGEFTNDVLVVAGDIHTRHQAGLWLDTVASRYKAVVCVLGNHDYWDASVENVLPQLHESIRHLPNVHILQRNSVVIEDTRFVGCTLWTKLPPEAMMLVKQTIKDFERIRIGHGQATLYPALVNAWHEQDKAYLEHELNKPFEGVTFVITHHAPCNASIDNRYKTNPQNALLNYAYHTDLYEWAQRFKFHTWVHGHTHHSFDYPFGEGRRVICNPRGYWPDRLNPDFQEHYTVDSLDLLKQTPTTQSSYSDWWSSMESPNV